MKISRKSKMKMLSLLDKVLKSSLLEIFCVVIGVAILYWINVYLLKRPFNFFSYFEVKFIASVSVTYAFALIIRKFAKKIEYRIEESGKINCDVEAILKCYENDGDFLLPLAYEPKKVVYPIIECVRFPERSAISVSDRPDMFYSLPPKVISMYSEIFKAHNGSDVFNNEMIRLDDFMVSEDKSKIELVTSRTTYFDSMVTNRALDFEISKNLTLRKMFDYNKSLASLKESVFSNHIGINGMILTADDHFVFQQRKGGFSIGKYSLGCSIGSAFETPDLGPEEPLSIKHFEAFVFSKLNKTYGKTVRESMGSIQWVSLYRDLLEGGKPQLLFFVKSNLTFNAIKRLESEFHKDVCLKFLPREGLALEVDGISYRKELAFGIKGFKKSIYTVPSTSASVAMILDACFNNQKQ